MNPVINYSRTFITLIGALSISLFASGCGKQCKKAYKHIVKPSNTVISYLDTNPGGQTLAAAGCGYILKEFQKIPEGAQTVRRIADQRFTHVNRYCLYWNEGTRYRCYRSGYHPPHHNPHHPRPYCRWERYTYCGRWTHDTVYEPGYDLAIELSQNLDIMYDKANHMCAQATSGNHDVAYGESRDLLTFLKAEVKPDSERVYAMACK